MASETTTANPELLQTPVASLLVQPLEAASVVLASGPRIFDTAAPLRIPMVTAGASVGFVAKCGLIPEADVDFGEITLMPSYRTSLKVLLRFTNELLRQSVIGLDATLKQRLVDQNWHDRDWHKWWWSTSGWTTTGGRGAGVHRHRCTGEDIRHWYTTTGYKVVPWHRGFHVWGFWLLGIFIPILVM